MSIPTTEVCPVCNGQGTITESVEVSAQDDFLWVDDGEYMTIRDFICYKCNGSGKVKPQKTRTKKLKRKKNDK